MYTSAGAELSGEADVKGTISTGKYADLAVLSADYFNVEDADISRIESVLTVVGGKIVWSSAEFEGLAAPLPAPAPAWSPVTEFDGFSANCAPVQPPTTGTHWPGGVRCACSHNIRRPRLSAGTRPSAAQAGSSRLRG